MASPGGYQHKYDFICRKPVIYLYEVEENAKQMDGRQKGMFTFFFSRSSLVLFGGSCVVLVS